MFTPDIMTYITAALAAIIGALGLYTRGQHYKIKSLDSEKKTAERQVGAAIKVAKINHAKAKLHKDVARTVLKNGTITKERISHVQEQIDAINNDEDFTLVL